MESFLEKTFPRKKGKHFFSRTNILKGLLISQFVVPTRNKIDNWLGNIWINKCECKHTYLAFFFSLTECTFPFPFLFWSLFSKYCSFVFDDLFFSLQAISRCQWGWKQENKITSEKSAKDLHGSSADLTSYDNYLWVLLNRNKFQTRKWKLRTIQTRGKRHVSTTMIISENAKHHDGRNESEKLDGG